MAGFESDADGARQLWTTCPSRREVSSVPNRAVHRDRNRTIARAKRSRRSYGAGEYTSTPRVRPSHWDVALATVPEAPTKTMKRKGPFAAGAFLTMAFAICLGCAGPDIAPLCSELSESDVACWLDLTDKPGCYVQLPIPHARWGHLGVIRTWTGECVEGLAEGSGTLEWDALTGAGDTIVLWRHTGHLRAGRYHGEWDEDHTFGPQASYYAGRGPYVEGARHGAWDLYFGKGFSDEGPYVDGKRHGVWVEMGEDRFPHIGRERREGPYVNGRRHGVWTITITRTENYDFEELEQPEVKQGEVRFVSGTPVGDMPLAGMEVWGDRY